MKIAILDGASTALIYPGHGEFPFYHHPKVIAAIADADIVLSHFTPFAPLIAKVRDPAELEVVEYRDRTRFKGRSKDYEHGVIALVGSTDPAEVAATKALDAEVHWHARVARTA